MSHPDSAALTDTCRIISDWAYALTLALGRGDHASAATAAATIAAAAQSALDILDPQEHVSPAVMHSNGHYIAPEPR